MSMGMERLAPVGAQVGESPLWLPERGVWLWLDLQGRRVHLHDPQTGENRVVAEGFAEDLACLVRWTEEAVLLVSVRGMHRLSLADGATHPLQCPINLPAGTIFNDGKADRHGALWLGSSDAAEAAPIGRLWRIAKGKVTEVATGFTVSNGPAFAPDGRTAYFADTFGRRLLRFDLDASGLPVAQAVFAETRETEGYPDGMTVDQNGTLHVGHWDGAKVSRWSPDGLRLSDLAIPARNVTSLAFGGADMRRAAVTTARLFPGQSERDNEVWNGDLVGFTSAVAGVHEPLVLFP
jgi:sugar lactone lactonase YvrE